MAPRLIPRDALPPLEPLTQAMLSVSPPDISCQQQCNIATIASQRWSVLMETSSTLPAPICAITDSGDPPQISKLLAGCRRTMDHGGDFDEALVG